MHKDSIMYVVDIYSQLYLPTYFNQKIHMAWIALISLDNRQIIQNTKMNKKVLN